ncbi:MAG: hypothetical protein J6T10_30615 [Methanobrevibacter sp.]|nr:hypothetical protein [Methanobrevibacter sp.]
MKKPSKNLAAFQREVERLERIVKKANKQGIVFLKSPIPETPERVTKKRLSLIQNITKLDVYSQGYEPDEVTGELKKIEDFRKTKKVKKYEQGIKGGIGRLRGEKEKPVKEKVEKVKKVKVKLTPEELREIRQKAGKKAAESLKKHMAEDPEFAERIIESRKRAFEKGRETRKKWEKEHPKEAFERRSKAAKKAAETRKEKEAKDKEYRERMRESRLKNLEKARESKKDKNEEDYFEEYEEYKPSKKERESYGIPDEEDEWEDNTREDFNDENYPWETDNIIGELYNALNNIDVNENVVGYLISLLMDEVDINGAAEVAERLKNAKDELLDRVFNMRYYEDYRVLASSAYAVARLILGGEVPDYVLRAIEGLASTDISYTKGW